MSERSASQLRPHQVSQQHQVSLEVLVAQEDQGDRHGHLSQAMQSQRGMDKGGCSQQWCELQVGRVSQWGEQDWVGLVVCVCYIADCSSPCTDVKVPCQCVYLVSTVEVWCTHLLPPQAAVPPPVQGTCPPSYPVLFRFAVLSLGEFAEYVKWESLSRA